MTVGSLFSGIGGLDRGLEMAGMETKWFCEIEEYPQQVLARHWPGVPIINDVRKITAGSVSPVDIIAGGFPCQDFSKANTGTERKGLKGEKSGRWSEFARVIRLLRPRYVIVENVPPLVSSGQIAEVTASLSVLGMDSEWGIIPSSMAGAPHRRERVWLVAYANDEGESDGPINDEAPILSKLRPIVWQWPDPPRGLRVDDGFPGRVDRIKALGNAVVPQVGYLVGRAVMEHAKETGRL